MSVVAWIVPAGTLTNDILVIAPTKLVRLADLTIFSTWESVPRLLEVH